MAAARALLIFTAAFELVALARVHVLGHPVSAVMPLLTPAADEPSFVRLWTLLAAVLCVVRVSQAAAMLNRAAWRAVALIHVVELAYFVAELSSSTSAAGRALAAAGRALVHGDAAPLVAAAPIVVVLAFIVLNAASFTYCWLATPDAAAAKAGPKGATAKRD